MYCCPGFSNLITNAGQRGFGAVLVKKRGGKGLYFQLQARIADAEEVLAVFADRPRASNYTLACATGLTYCPWCGQKLDEVIDRLPDAADLLRRHADYAM
jgi:hypothetical protein